MLFVLAQLRFTSFDIIHISHWSVEFQFCTRKSGTSLVQFPFRHILNPCLYNPPSPENSEFCQSAVVADMVVEVVEDKVEVVVLLRLVVVLV